MTEAFLSETNFANADLTGVIGLETCRHGGPSIIDYRTLQKSRHLPLPFLRGVGLPDRLIEYLPSLFDQAIQYFSCFISYSTKDQDFADRLYDGLQGNGVRCWFAPHDIPIGGKILDEIDAAIRLRDKVLLILSERSIQSGWVEDEVTKAFEEERKRRQIVLFPIRLEEPVAGLAARERGRRGRGRASPARSHPLSASSGQRPGASGRGISQREAWPAVRSSADLPCECYAESALEVVGFGG
jgi:hypothetical protein